MSLQQENTQYRTHINHGRKNSIHYKGKIYNRSSTVVPTGLKNACRHRSSFVHHEPKNLIRQKRKNSIHHKRNIVTFP